MTRRPSLVDILKICIILKTYKSLRVRVGDTLKKENKFTALVALRYSMSDEDEHQLSRSSSYTLYT